MNESPKTILLVEDNDLDVFMIRRLLKKMALDLPLIHARNGEEALRILRPEGSDPALVPPFIMIVDINMPRMNGFELLDELNDDPILSQVPVYLVTTSTRKADRQKALDYCIRDYVVKPVSQSVMQQMLQGKCGINAESR